MAIRRIVEIGDEKLRKIAKRVDKYDLRLRILLKDMADTMYKAEGVGLAAPQVGILRRAVVIDVGVNRDPESGKLCGDVDFDACEPISSVITKVPGGVGPMTITELMGNTIEAFRRKMER